MTFADFSFRCRPSLSLQHSRLCAHHDPGTDCCVDPLWPVINDKSYDPSQVGLRYSMLLERLRISLGNDSFICFFLAHALRVIEDDRAFEKVL
jgi:hypothetical protein